LKITPTHLLQLGGKGLGLVELTQLSQSGLFKVPKGFILPAQRGRLKPHQGQSVRQALLQLEQQTNRSFDRHTLKVAVRSGAAISMQGLMDTYLNVANADAVISASNRVYKSWSGKQAREYQQRTGIPARWGSAVSVIEMIDPTLDANSGSGIAKSTKTGFKNIFALQKWGSVLVNGSDQESDALPHQVDKQLEQTLHFLESVYRQPVEIEYAVQRGELYLLQIRKAPLTPAAELDWAISRMQSLDMTQTELAARVNHLISIQKINKYRVDTEGLKPLAQGTFGEGNPFVGPVTTNPSQYPVGQSIFVSPSADAKEVTAQAMHAGALFFPGGNPLAHLAGIATTLGLSFLGGIDIKVFNNQIIMGDTIIPEGTLLTLDPASNALYDHELAITEIENVAELIVEPDDVQDNLAPELFSFTSLSPVSLHVGLSFVH
ncbi:MAG: hypothetical protein ACD_73C00389G0001, partial [uncultured bacterium]